ncbi:MAG: Nif11-like leader peptide family natural product precursor [Bacteroidetes Order II. Incertae sedis bacterium]|jgi:predicted ribosomally synthesized peptide with nif11-like leader|nr:Nif11-like leader peptide family natural product precursor [Bacteroidetes Order II. bacterium]
MSKESLEQFIRQVADSEELQAKIGEEIDAETLIALGAELGCEFTGEDLQEASELSDEELDDVAGGGKRDGARGRISFTKPSLPKVGNQGLVRSHSLQFHFKYGGIAKPPCGDVIAWD